MKLKVWWIVPLTLFLLSLSLGFAIVQGTRNTFFVPKPTLIPPDSDPTLGDPSAPVTIIEFSDFTCTYCQLFAQQRTRQRILEQYPQTVRWIYRSFPAAHPEAEAAAEAAQCAYEQDKFWSYQDALYQNQARLAAPVYFELAQTQGLDTDRFYRCMREGRYKAIALDASAAVRYNVRVLPTFVVNGEIIEGLATFEDLAARINRLIKR